MLCLYNFHDNRLCRLEPFKPFPGVQRKGPIFIETRTAFGENLQSPCHAWKREREQEEGEEERAREEVCLALRVRTSQPQVEQEGDAPGPECGAPEWGGAETRWG